MRFLTFALINLISYILFVQVESKFILNISKKFNKKSKEFEGCVDATEPFNCPGTNSCISLQFVCDGIAGDCPNDYDENPNLCNAFKRPPKDTIVRFLTTQYTNYGTPFIVYMFGNRAAMLFQKMSVIDANSKIAAFLAVSPTINEFAISMNMNELEKKRFGLVLEKINTGQISQLPVFIKDSISEGLGSLVDNLIKTNFMPT